MTRRFLAVTVFLAATVAFLIGLVVAGTMTPARAASTPPSRDAAPELSAPSSPSRAIVPAAVPAKSWSFADIAERLNPAVVNIDATSRGEDRQRRRSSLLPQEPEPFDRPLPRDREGPRRGAGTGFIIDAAGLILTNHHVIEG